MAEVPRSDVTGRQPGRPPAPAADGTTHVPPRRDSTRAGYSTVVEDGFSGWTWFTGGLLVLVGLFQVMLGTVALAGGSGFYTVPTRALVVDASYATWGWLHLVLGLAALVIGGGLVFGNIVARVAGVAWAVISALVNLVFMPAAPFAATLVIALDVFVIYAITVHGGEPKRAHS
jgi:hypothetical protein